MNRQEICEFVEILNDAIESKDWSIVEDALMYIKDYCHDYDADKDKDKD